MGRPRQYAGDAERQRACRQRREAETVRVERRALEGLHMRLERLQQAIGRAAAAGDATARAGRAISGETVLERLIEYFEACANGSMPPESRPAPRHHRRR